ncbi:S8 family serine peptidase [Rhizobium leguminosarum]|uniref:S8 family serine peptidase n=1 Tax=Rhizobium leguminosarum TaxID=384 RepID=UPI001F187E75|nr:S8 family serine peptidase [Rhizobium leguminosarum]UIK19516.1 S8 family serine peptidase [Rhizobium leguminosarum]
MDSGKSSIEEVLLRRTFKGPADATSLARVALFDDDIEAVTTLLLRDFSTVPLAPEHRAANEILVTFSRRRFRSDEDAFRLADAFVERYDLDAAEPEIFFRAMPVDQTDDVESMGNLLGCWAAEQAGLSPLWALDAIRAPQAWAYAASKGRSAKGSGVLIAQPDTGVTKHDELQGITFVAPRNLLRGKPNDPTDPLPKTGNPGHGTSTASVAVSPETLAISGSAPWAQLMPIRAIEKVWLVSQIKVAQAIDHAVNNGASIITMSLGGLPSLSLQAALSRASDAGVIVMAAAGNCVKEVVYPARYDKCLAIAGVDNVDKPWVGTCKGREVDFAAPAQNVYRATAPNKGVAQGQGTSYAVAITAGAAACWLAFHGRSNVVTEAKKRGETVNRMFRRLVRATVRVPEGWDFTKMGAGVIDLEALLKAGFDVGMGTETTFAVEERPEDAIKSLAVAKLGADGLRPDLDWYRHGTEIGLSLMRDGRLPPGAATEGVDLSAARDNARAPSVRRPREKAAFELLKQQSAIIEARDKVEAGVATSMENGLEAAGEQPLSRHAAEATLARIMEIAEKLPPREIPNKAAFVAALNQLHQHGKPLLKKLTGEDLGSSAAVRAGDVAGLEAMIIADGSRPSFLIEKNLPPLEHPFMGDWGDEMRRAHPNLVSLTSAIGRIQPEFGHSRLFLGTGALVDAKKGIVLTNYHVVDDAQSQMGILMEQKGQRKLKVHGWLEIDFVGEEACPDTNRFRVIEVMLPKRAGRDYGWLDAAALRIVPINSAVMPATPICFNPEKDLLTEARSQSVATIGFPGPPRKNQGNTRDIDWGFVMDTLFGGHFGVKRLAPGKLMKPVGTNPADTLKIAFDHDLTTFGGSSGSPLFAWENESIDGFGLHFRGINGESNAAIAVERVADELKEIGVPL